MRARVQTIAVPTKESFELAWRCVTVASRRAAAGHNRRLTSAVEVVARSHQELDRHAVATANSGAIPVTHVSGKYFAHIATVKG